LTIAYCSILLANILVLELAAYIGTRWAINAVVDRELESRMMGIDDYMSRHMSKAPWTQPDGFRHYSVFQPDLLEIRDGDGRVIFPGNQQPRFGNQRFRRETQLRTLTSGTAVVRVMTQRRTIQGKNFDLALGTDLLIPAALLRDLGWMMIGSFPVILGVAAAAGYWLGGRALAPVSAMTEGARAIDSSNLSSRIAVPHTRDELQRLAETMNGMLSRIEDGFRHVSQFTANASHELRTPLAVMRTTAEVALLKHPSRSSVYREALQEILREAERNSILLEDMIQLARLDSAAGRKRREWVELGTLAESVTGQIAVLAAQKRIQLRTRVDTSDARVLADGAQLRRLLQILIENAIRYTPEGGSVAIVISEGPAGTLLGTVADTGVGIPESDLPHIFERFYRVDQSRSRADGGAGLGLSIASKIAEAHGASIRVKSQPGKGSVFEVSFPRGSVREATDQKTSARKS
jgi:heavy metal sensor kinase